MMSLAPGVPIALQLQSVCIAEQPHGNVIAGYIKVFSNIRQDSCECSEAKNVVLRYRDVMFGRFKKVTGYLLWGTIDRERLN